MIWLSWRLQRTETLLAFGVLALLTAWLVPTGLDMWNAYQHAALGACIVHQAPRCNGAIGLFRARFGGITNLASWFNLLPGLIGVLLATSFVSDLEHGTYRLAWTQSVTRRRWLLSKLGLAVVSALLAAGGLIALFTWWRAPEAHLDGRLDGGVFGTSGIVMLGYTLFALGVALALGAVWRRTAVSLLVGFVAYVAVRLMVEFKVRDHLVAAVHATWRGRPPASLDNANVLSLFAIVHGHRVLNTGSFDGGSVKFQAPGIAHAVFHAVFQPQSHYWPLQLTETALFAGMAILLIAFAAWRALRAD